MIELFEQRDEKCIEMHIQGTALVIDMFVIPSSLRGKGVGTQTYFEIEQNAPDNITRIEIMAADIGAGTGPSNGFWESVGFDYIYIDRGDIPDQMSNWMWKGINGHKTPASIEPDISS